MTKIAYAFQNGEVLLSFIIIIIINEISIPYLIKIKMSLENPKKLKQRKREETSK